MRVTCSQEQLARGLSIVGRAVATRTTLPVLSNVYIGTDNGRLKLVATNLEIGITAWVPAQVIEEGATTVPARLIEDLVKQSPAETIELEMKNANELGYHCASISATIRGIPAEEFPIIPTSETAEGEVVTLPADLLKEMISQVVFAAATDEMRPVLTGVLVKFENDTLTMAAADGYRMSVRSAAVGATVEAPVSVIVPARALNELARILPSDSTVDVILSPNRNQILFHADDMDLVSQLIEGAFPDYRKIIPQTHKTRTVVDTNQLLQAVRRALIFARDAANIVRLRFEPGNGLEGRMVVSAQATEAGGNEEVLPAAVEGDAMEVAFNGRYLVDVLSVMHSAQTVIQTQSSSHPGVFRPANEDTNFTHVIMPMHI